MKILNKICFITAVLGFLTSTVGQIAWTFIFWNNDEMFMGHWGIALVGLGMFSLALPLPLYYMMFGKD